MSTNTNKSYGNYCPPLEYSNAYWENQKKISNTDYIWKFIERPFVNLFSPKNDVWWSIGENNKHFPPPDLYPLSRTEEFIHILIHIGLWVPIYYSFYAENPISLIITFLFGLITLILYDFFKEQNFTFTIAGVSTDEKGLTKNIYTITKSGLQQDGTSVIGKNDIYNMDDKEGFLYKGDVFKKIATNNKIPIQSLAQYYEKNCGNNDDVTNLSILTSIDPDIINTGFYIVSAVITIGIIDARITKKSITNTLPLLIYIASLTLIGVYFYRVDFSAKEVSLNKIRRDKLVIESISISLLFCCISLFRN